MVGVSLLAIATTAIIVPISASRMQSESADELLTAASLARQLIEEIASRPLHDPLYPLSGVGPEAGESGRAQFSNIDDYDGYSDSTASLAALNGVAAAAPDDRGVYHRQVKVNYRTSPGGGTVSYGDFAIVTVTVTAPHGQTVTVPRVFSSYARN
jgi:hypothetical protein